MTKKVEGARKELQVYKDCFELSFETAAAEGSKTSDPISQFSLFQNRNCSSDPTGGRELVILAPNVKRN